MRACKPSRLRAVAILAVIGLVGGWLIHGWWWKWVTESVARSCRDAVARDDWDVASKLVDKWVARAPDDLEGWLLRAEIAKQRKDWVGTEESLARVPPTDRRYLKIQELRGDLVLDALHRPDRAIDIWKSMLEVDRDSPLAHQRLIYVYAMTLRRAEMIAQIREAIRLRAEPPEAYGYLLAANSLIFSDGYLRTSQWLRESPEDPVLNVARAVFAARTNPSKGLRMFGDADGLTANRQFIEKCFVEYPDNLEVLAFFIDRVLTDGEFDQLEELLSNLPPAADLDSRFWRYRAVLHDSQRDVERAVLACQKAVDLHPLDWKAHHDLGNYARFQNQLEMAEHHSRLGERGKQLEREMLELPNASLAGPELLERMYAYGRDCGDTDFTDGLAYRLGTPSR